MHQSTQISATHRADIAEPWSGQLQIWLYSVAALIFILVLVGGITRLTDSGLSITEWQPIIGMLPPLNSDQWVDAFQKYQQIPEYKEINRGMDLAAFKTIYWWEWAHRFLGRLVGFAFMLPFLYFLLRGRIASRYVPKMLLLFVLGGLQGGLGWYMVKSGLVDRVDVSQYRLAAHLGLAALILAAIVWIARSLSPTPIAGKAVADRRDIIFSGALSTLIFLQIILGALVAGMNAGLSHNTWPLMDGALIPSGLWALSPLHLNLFENALTVQFDHRMLAYLLVILAVWHLVRVLRNYGEGQLVVYSASIVTLLLVQVGVGIGTLLLHVPNFLASLHQGLGILLFLFSVLQLQVTIAHHRHRVLN